MRWCWKLYEILKQQRKVLIKICLYMYKYTHNERKMFCLFWGYLHLRLIRWRLYCSIGWVGLHIVVAWRSLCERRLPLGICWVTGSSRIGAHMIGRSSCKVNRKVVKLLWVFSCVFTWLYGDFQPLQHEEESIEIDLYHKSHPPLCLGRTSSKTFKWWV